MQSHMSNRLTEEAFSHNPKIRYLCVSLKGFSTKKHLLPTRKAKATSLPPSRHYCDITKTSLMKVLVSQLLPWQR